MAPRLTGCSVALAAACLAGSAALWGAERSKALLLRRSAAACGAALAAEAVLALIAFGPATVVMGALFSHLVASACAAGAGFGRALGANTLGAAAAPLRLRGAAACRRSGRRRRCCSSPPATSH